MKTSRTVLAAIAGLCLFATAAQAVVAPGEIELTIKNASGVPGSVVFPTISFPMDGFEFDALTLELTYDPSALAFQPDASTVTFNGASQAFTSLPGYLAGPAVSDGNLQRTIYSTISVSGVPVTGPLVLTGSFQILGGAVPGQHLVAISGSVSTDPVFEEVAFSNQLSVTAVPEPETWLLWIGGIGMLAARATRRRRAETAT